MRNILNLMAFLVSMSAFLYMLFSIKESKLLKKGLMFITIGIFSAITIHAFFEFLESFGYFEIDILLYMMPILVIIGSIIIFFGSKELQNNVTKPILKITEALKSNDPNLKNLKVEDKHSDNEIGIMIKAINDSRQALEDKNLNLDDEVKKKTKELQIKIEDLEKINNISINRELKMIELKKRIIELEKNS